MGNRTMALNKAKQLAWAIMVDRGMDFDSCRHKMRGFYSRSRSINDEEMKDHVSRIPAVGDLLYDDNIISRFEKSFAGWIQSNDLNSCSGLENFQPDISQGATQAFDSFYLRHRGRKLRMFAGEYLYHIVVAKQLGIEWSFLDSADQLGEDDALILSIPFCDTGNLDNELDQILRTCEDKGVPVLLDCAYYTISKDIHLDVNFKCIDTVTFSLSKTFPIAHARIGMRYTRPEIQDGQKLHSNINYDNRISAGIGLHFIDRFRSDHVYKKYQSLYKAVTDYLELEPSQTIIFAEGDNEWEQYGRRDILQAYGLDHDQSMYRNRICVTELLENEILTRRMIDETN
jgi:hypothetical protein